MKLEAGVRGWESVMGVPMWVANRLQQALQPRGHMETLGRPVWCIPAHPPGVWEEEEEEI